MNLAAVIVFTACLVTGILADDDDYYSEDENGSERQDTDFMEDDESDGPDDQRDVFRECFPGGGMPPPPPPDYPDYEGPSRYKKAKKSSKMSAPMMRMAPSCKEFEEALVKQTQAMLKKDGKPCQSLKDAQKCRWRYMTMARKKMEDPSEKCMMQMKQIYMM